MTVLAVHHANLKSAMAVLTPDLAYGPISRCWLAMLFLRALVENQSMNFTASSVANNLGASWLIDTSLQSLLPSSHGLLPLCLYLCVSPLAIKRHSHIGLGPTLLCQYDHILTSYICYNPISK